MQWAKALQTLLKAINKYQIDKPDLAERTKQHYRQQYQQILKQGDIECPPPNKTTRIAGQRGRLERTKSRALL